MQRNWRKFAPLGLYLALAAALAAAGIYIVQNDFTLALQIALGLVVIGLAVYALLDPLKIREILTGRQARYSSNALILTIAFLGIIVVINYLANNYTKRWDLTEDKIHTLSPETLEILEKLDQSVTAQAFYTVRTSSESARTLLENIKLASNGKFDYQFIDPEADPVAAQAARISRDATIVLKVGDQQEQIAFADEQEITAAMIRLMNPESRGIYFLTGHGEFDIDGYGEDSYNQAKRTLETKNYKVEKLNLVNTSVIPEDAKTIVIAGAQKQLSVQEVDLLKDYQENGGALVVLYEPEPLPQPEQDADPLAVYLLQSWGVEIGNNIIIDPNVNPPFVTVADSYGIHPITQKMARMTLTAIFPTARSVAQVDTPAGVTQAILAFTSANAWGETDFEGLENNRVTADQEADLMGPLPIAIAATNTQSNARLVIFGDSDFASDRYFQSYGNSDFFINSLDWAAEQENLINLTPKESTTRIMLPPQQTTLGLILLISVFLLPGLVIAFGISAWIQRRRRG